MPQSFVQLPADGSGKKLATFQEVVGASTVENQYVALRDGPTFGAVFDRIVPAAGKYMATLFNTTSTRLVRVHRIWSFNWQVAAVTGVLHEHELRYVTARTVGTAITPSPRDSADALTAGITADHATTGVTAGALIRRFFGSSEEVKIGALTLESSLHGLNPNALIFDAGLPGERPIILRQNRGVTAKMITSTTVGTGSFVFEFSDDPA